MNIHLLKKLFIWFFGIRLISSLIRCFLEFDLPHTWRQSDTLAVAIRYYIRFFEEFDSKLLPLPAVLNNGDTYGIMPMEFPFLNFITSPFFAWGPYWGKVAACLFLIAIHVLVGVIAARNFAVFEDQERESVRRWSFLPWVLPLVGISSVYFGKFMPDYLAMMLVLLGISYTFAKQSMSLSIFFCCLGVLIKPTSIIVLGLLLVPEFKDEKLKKHFINTAIVGSTSVLCAFIYYTKGIAFIKSFQEGTALFAVEMRHPLTSLIEFFSSSSDLLDLLADKMLGIAALPLLIIVSIFSLENSHIKILKLWGLFVIQLIAIAALDGSHSFIHEYYHIGVSPTLAMILIVSLTDQRPRKISKQIWWSYGLLLLLFIQFTNVISTEIRALYLGIKPTRSVSYSQCLDLKERNNEVPWNRGFTFRSTKYDYPILGICFGEKVNSNISEWGIFLKSDTNIPSECKLVDESRDVVLAKCDS